MATKQNVATFTLMVLCFAYLAECGVIETNETGDSDYFGVHIYPIERNCAMVGGICVHMDDCEAGQHTTKRGLCSKNSHVGAECCYSVIARPATCRQLLGLCMETCKQGPVRTDATDCPVDTQCCTLIF